MAHQQPQFGMIVKQPPQPLPPIEAIPGIPPGLEYVSQLDKLLVRQKIELMEMLTGCEMQNKYEVMNKDQQQIFYAQEESDCMMRQCCGPARGFIIHITDSSGREVIRVTREFRCCVGCCWCASVGSTCSYEVTVESPPGQVVGKIKQDSSGCAPHFKVFDQHEQEVFEVWGLICMCQGPCCPGDIDFPLLTKDGRQVGRIFKQWAGCIKESFTDADRFGIEFPLDLDVKMKAVLLGAVFYVDFMYFEQQQNNNNQ